VSDISFKWSDQALGALSISFDDGGESNVDLAIPILAEYDLPATFYVPMNEGGPFDRAASAWREAVRAGHEIGNHSMTHPCSANFGFSRPCLDEMSLDDISSEIVSAKRRIEEGLPDQTEHSFAYPCGETHVGVGGERTSYVPVVAKHYNIGRGIGDFPNDPLSTDLAAIWSYMPSQPSAGQLVEWAEVAAGQGRWVVLTFHNVGPGGLGVGIGALRELLEYLVANRKRIWTDSVVKVGRWIRDSR
jgi:peptidoglycan/xylan/chitin deacetylase (PgdA/CDA1 family)